MKKQPKKKKQPDVYISQAEYCRRHPEVTIQRLHNWIKRGKITHKKRESYGKTITVVLEGSEVLLETEK